MSFLADSASCAAGSNPLTQLASKQSVDRSLQNNHVRASPAGPSSLRGGELRNMSMRDRELFQSMQQHSDGRADAFRFEEMRKEMPTWASEFQSRATNGGASSPASQEMARQELVRAQSAAQPQMSGKPQMADSWASEFASSSHAPQASAMAFSQSGQMPMSMPYGMGGMYSSGYTPMMGLSQNTAFGMSQNQMPGAQQQQQQSSAIIAEDSKWEEQFNKIEQAQRAQTETVQAEGAADQKEQVGHKDVLVLDQGTEVLEDIDDVDVSPETARYFDNSFPPNWDQIWDQINRTEDGALHTRGGILDMPSSTGEQYEFAKENEYANEEDPFALGVYMMDNGAKLSCAVLCFEEAVKRNPEHVEAWARLGDAQAQNEVEGQAILALEKAVILAPHHKEALLNLAISYTNEGYDTVASQVLEKWFAASYPDIAASVPASRGDDGDALHKRVTEMFLKAAQRGSAVGEIDPNVQVGLGVLFYRDEDFSKAIDCFKAALAVRPNDASLWNRLGATLANASRPEDAIEAYYQALKLRPSFVRARYNLAVSCINIGCYKEAADHLLSAMSLHETEEGTGIDFDRSSNLVETLRRVFFAMDRRDLLVKLRPDMQLSDFKSEFNF